MKRGRGKDHEKPPPPKRTNPMPPHAGYETLHSVPKVKDALGYLEEVKVSFFDQPEVYDNFLEIMKEFKAQTLDTEGVIARVKELFKGHRSLIQGFNQFLPDGYQIEPPPVAPKPTMEFNHAVQYVAKIKERFYRQPDVYEEFLDILHAYQEKPQMEEAILEVKTRVHKLFAGHPDLLEEFSYFLPDSVKGPAVMIPPQTRQVRNPPNNPRLRPRKQPAKAAYERKASPPRERPPIKKNGRSRRPKKESDGDYDRVGKAITYPANCEVELNLCERMKDTLPPQQYSQFLRALNLYSNDIISRVELVELVDQILGPNHAEFLVNFKTSVGYDEWEEKSRTNRRTSYYDFVTSVDFLSCAQITPSYRQLPPDIPIPSCAARNQLSDSVLNDYCVSIPTGTEDSSFKSKMQNQYEQRLFKLEDDRYELDLMIASNRSVIRKLQPIKDEINSMTTEQGKSFSLGPDQEFSPLHTKAICRLYGDHGYEIVKLLHGSPATAVPIVLQRLQEKAAEWRGIRADMRDYWRQVMETNCAKALDHRSLNFKMEDKKTISTKTLLSEVEEAHHRVQCRLEQRPETEIADMSHGSDVTLLQPRPAPTVDNFYDYAMQYKYPDESIHQDIYDMLLQLAFDTFSDDERDEFRQWWKKCNKTFFDVTIETPDMPIEGAVENGDVVIEDIEAQRTPLDSKPSLLVNETFELIEKFEQIRRHSRPSRLFFGNAKFYYLFRFHQILYYRLLEAKKLSKLDGGKVGTSVDASVAKDKYRKFLDCLKSCLNGNIESGRYEDDVRQLLGADSYIFFSIDKVARSMVSQLQVVLSENDCIKLYNLFENEVRCFEEDKKNEASCGLSARIYQHHASSIITRNHQMMQFEFFLDTKELGITLCDHSILPAPQSTTEQWKKYIKKHTQIPSIEEYNRKKPPKSAPHLPPYLGRVWPRACKNDPRKGVVRSNALQVRVAENFAQQYENVTCDNFQRFRKEERWNEKNKKSFREKRTKQFATWMKSRNADVELDSSPSKKSLAIVQNLQRIKRGIPPVESASSSSTSSAPTAVGAGSVPSANAARPQNPPTRRNMRSTGAPVHQQPNPTFQQIPPHPPHTIHQHPHAQPHHIGPGHHPAPQRISHMPHQGMTRTVHIQQSSRVKPIQNLSMTQPMQNITHARHTTHPQQHTQHHPQHAVHSHSHHHPQHGQQHTTAGQHQRQQGQRGRVQQMGKMLFNFPPPGGNPQFQQHVGTRVLSLPNPGLPTSHLNVPIHQPGTHPSATHQSAATAAHAVVSMSSGQRHQGFLPDPNITPMDTSAAFTPMHTQSHPQTHPQTHPQPHPQPHPQTHPQPHAQSHPQPHPQSHPQSHQQATPQQHPQQHQQSHPQMGPK